jgi:hypothetical protein
VEEDKLMSDPELLVDERALEEAGAELDWEARISDSESGVLGVLSLSVFRLLSHHTDLLEMKRSAGPCCNPLSSSPATRGSRNAGVLP